MGFFKKDLGDKAEEAVCRYLRRQGLKTVARNYRCALGEIDLIMREKKTLVFVEVRGKSNESYGLPEETVDRRKQQKVRRAAEHYLHATNQMESYCRFDVAAVVWHGERAEIRWYRDAF